MYYTVTLNPALDYIMKIVDFKSSALNRSSEEHIVVGGKGINVSIMLRRLGEETTALGFVGGFTGEEVCQRLESEGVRHKFCNINNGMTRINVKLISDHLTELNAAGPTISNDDLAEFMKTIAEIKKDDTLILSGKVPLSFANIYVEIIEALPSGVRLVVDTSGQELLDIIKFNPYLIKPNDEEMREIFSGDDYEACAAELLNRGAQNVLLSLGKDGAMLFCKDGMTYKCDAPEGKPINAVGAGDSMLAGFLHSIDRGDSRELALKYAVATGSATAFCEWLATKREIEELL